MKGKFICGLLAGALIQAAILSGCNAPTEGSVLSSPTPSSAVTEDGVIQVLTGRPGDTPYLTYENLTATTEDYMNAVRDVGNSLWYACWQRNIPFQEYPDSPEASDTLDALFGGGTLISDDPVYTWDNTVDGVPFDRYLDQQARVLAFYRVWRESELAPAPTETEFQTWAEEQTTSGGYLRFYFIPVEDGETAQKVRDILKQNEDCLEEVWESYSVTPEADMIFAGTLETFVPEIAQALTGTNSQWTAVSYVPRWDTEKTYYAVVKELPLIIENYRDLLVEETWPTAITPDRIILANGVEELDAAKLYERWHIWAIENQVSITVSTQSRIPDEAVIVPAKKADTPDEQRQSNSEQLGLHIGGGA